MSRAGMGAMLVCAVLVGAACAGEDGSGAEAESAAPPPAPGLEAAATTQPSVVVTPDTSAAGADTLR